MRKEIAGARQNLSIREALALEELIVDYQHAFEKKRTVTINAQKVYTTVSISAKTGPFVSHNAESL